MFCHDKGSCCLLTNDHTVSISFYSFFKFYKYFLFCPPNHFFSGLPICIFSPAMDPLLAHFLWVICHLNILIYSQTTFMWSCSLFLTHTFLVSAHTHTSVPHPSPFCFSTIYTLAASFIKHPKNIACLFHFSLTFILFPQQQVRHVQKRLNSNVECMQVWCYNQFSFEI